MEVATIIELLYGSDYSAPILTEPEYYRQPAPGTISGA